MEEYFQSLPIDEIRDISLDFGNTITSEESGTKIQKIRVMRNVNGHFKPIIIDSPYVEPDIPNNWQSTNGIFTTQSDKEVMIIRFGNNESEKNWLKQFGKFVVEILNELTKNLSDVVIPADFNNFAHIDIGEDGFTILSIIVKNTSSFESNFFLYQPELHKGSGLIQFPRIEKSQLKETNRACFRIKYQIMMGLVTIVNNKPFIGSYECGMR